MVPKVAELDMEWIYVRMIEIGLKIRQVDSHEYSTGLVVFLYRGYTQNISDRIGAD